MSTERKKLQHQFQLSTTAAKTSLAENPFQHHPTPPQKGTHHRACDVAGTNSRESAMQTFQVNVGREKEDQIKRS